MKWKFVLCVVMFCIVHVCTCQTSTIDPIVISSAQPSSPYFLYFPSFPSTLHFDTYPNVTQFFISLPDTQYILQAPITIYLLSSQSVTFSSQQQTSQLVSNTASTQEVSVFRFIWNDTSVTTQSSNIIFNNLNFSFIAQQHLFYFSSVTFSSSISLHIVNGSIIHSNSIFQSAASISVTFFSLKKMLLRNNSSPQLFQTISRVEITDCVLLDYSNAVFYFSQVNNLSFVNNQLANCSNIQSLSSLLTVSRVNNFLMDQCQVMNNQGIVASVLTVEWSTNVIIQNSQFFNNIALHSGAVMNLRGLYPFITQQCSIANCKFVNNQAMNGGVMIVEQSSMVSLVDSQFINNTVTRHGGVVYSSNGMDQLQVTRCLFDGNRAEASGGVLYLVNGKQVTIQQSSLVNNQALLHGGALYHMTTTSPLQLSVSTSQFANNQAFQFGGDVYVDNSLLTIPHLMTTSVTLQQCQMNHSRANAGASLYLTHVSSFVMDDCTLSHHVATTNGTMLLRSVNWIQLSNSNFANNQVSQFGGVIYLDGSAVQLFQLSNCSLQYNRAKYGGCVALPDHDTAVDKVIVQNCTEAFNTAISGGLVFSNEKVEFPMIVSNSSFDINGYVQVTYPVSYQVQFVTLQNATTQSNLLYASQQFQLHLRLFDKYRQLVYHFDSFDRIQMQVSQNYSVNSDYEVIRDSTLGAVWINKLTLQNVADQLKSSTIRLSLSNSPLQVIIPFDILYCPYQTFQLIPNMVQENRYSCVPATCQYGNTNQQSTIENSLFITCLVLSGVYIFVIGISSTKYTFSQHQQWITLDMGLMVVECVKLACCIATVVLQYLNLPIYILHSVSLVQLLAAQCYTSSVIPKLWRAATCHLSKKKRILYYFTWSSLTYTILVGGSSLIIFVIQLTLFIISVVHNQTNLMGVIAILSFVLVFCQICCMTIVYYVLQMMYRKNCKEWDESNWNILLNSFKLFTIPVYLIWCCSLDSLVWIIYYHVTCPSITLFSAVMIYGVGKWLQIIAQNSILPATMNYHYSKLVKKRKHKYTFVNNPMNQLSKIFSKDDKCYYSIQLVKMVEMKMVDDRHVKLWTGTLNDQSTMKHICIQQISKQMFVNQINLKDFCLELSDVMNRNFKYVTSLYGFAETEDSILVLSSELEYQYLMRDTNVTSLYDLIVSKNQLSFVDKLKCLYHIAMGLQELHLRSFAHRCLTCYDILYVKSSDKYVICHIGNGKLEDAFLGRQLANSKSQIWKNRFPNRLMYMAPEVFKYLVHHSNLHSSTMKPSYTDEELMSNEDQQESFIEVPPSLIQSMLQQLYLTPHQYDEQVDVWSFGIIMCCLLYNTVTPFSLSDHIQQLLTCQSKYYSIEMNNKVLLESLQENNNGWVLELMKQCFAMDAYERPTIDSILQTLRTELSRSKQ